MNRKSVSPSVEETAFDCPHCGAYTTQSWQKLYAEPMRDDLRIPHLPDESFRENVAKEKDIDPVTRREIIEWVDRMSTGFVHLDPQKENTYLRLHVENLHLSKCFNCKKIAVWVHDRMVFPAQRDSDMPNPDMPDDIVRDFEEARGIVKESARGATALLRLCIQKLCFALGEKGRNIDEDIASLVKKGLNPLVQKSLDAVRVIGNEAVHPGTIDLRDNRATALQLFKLVNLIVEQMITLPKSVDEIYNSLPEPKRAAIEKRDAKK